MSNFNEHEDEPRVPVLDLDRQTRKHRIAIDNAIERVLDRSNFILGSEVRAFEMQFAEYVGTKYCVGVANGTDAIELALRALGVGKGTKVATVANAGNYATTAILAIGAIPFYMDVDLSTRNVTLTEVQRAIAAGAKVAVITHLYGMAIPEIKEIAKACREAGIGLVEDCAQAHGAEVDGAKVGSFGDASSFSFYPTKNLGALGDGGAVVTSSQDISSALRKLRVYGWDEKYSVTLAGGRNSRLDEIQAAILSALLPFLDSANEERRRIARVLNAKIDNPTIALPRFTSKEFVGHLYVIASLDRAALISKLHSHGIDTAIHYPIPDHRQPLFLQSASSVSLPVTESLAEQVVSLPCFPEMTDKEIRRVIAAVNSK